MASIAEILCFALFMVTDADRNPNYYDEENFEVCLNLVDLAFAQGVDPEIVIATSWVESRLTEGLVSYTGCCHGPLQINPYYHCPDNRLRGCDLSFYGVNALKRYRDRYNERNYSEPLYRIYDFSEWAEPLCHYNAGNVCNEQSRRYARLIINIANEVSYTYDAIEENYLMTCVQ